MTKAFVVFMLALSLLASPWAWSQEQDASPAPPAPAPAAAPPITLAVLDFEVADVPGASGKQVADALGAMLSGQPGIRLVERAQIDQIVKELEVNLSGLVETEQAVKVGKLVGARLIVTGRVFLLGQSAMITAKIIGTETSLVDGLLVRGKVNTPTDDLVMQLAEKLMERLPEVAPRLVAASDKADPLIALQKSLADRPKPRVSVWVLEQHITPQPAAPDPAVQTEIEHLLQQCGFTVVQLPPAVTAQWLHGGRVRLQSDWPAQISDVDMLIVGEAFSEEGARIGQLYSCGARAEVKLLNRHTAEVPLTDRATTRQADTSSHLAGRGALQQAGRELGLRILSYFDKTLPVAVEKGP